MMSTYPSGNPQKNPLRWFIVVFGLFWTGMAVFIVVANVGGPGMILWPAFIFPLFGVFFVGFALKSALRGKQPPAPSSPSEPSQPPTNDDDPFAKFDSQVKKDDHPVILCPRCGSHVDWSDAFCSKCGTRLR